METLTIKNARNGMTIEHKTTKIHRTLMGNRGVLGERWYLRRIKGEHHHVQFPEGSFKHWRIVENASGSPVVQPPIIDDGGLACDKTLRDEYAGQSLAGYRGLTGSAAMDSEYIARLAFFDAAAMIAEKRRAEGATIDLHWRHQCGNWVPRTCSNCKSGEWDGDRLEGCGHDEATNETCRAPDFKLWEPKAGRKEKPCE